MCFVSIYNILGSYNIFNASFSLVDDTPRVCCKDGWTMQSTIHQGGKVECVEGSTIVEARVGTWCVGIDGLWCWLNILTQTNMIPAIRDHGCDAPK